MWYLQHGRSKGWEDSADANNRKCPSFTAGLCYPKNSVSPADPPKQDIECPLRDCGIIFFHSLSFLLRAWKRGLYFAVTTCASSAGQGQRMWGLPCFFSLPVKPDTWLTAETSGLEQTHPPVDFYPDRLNYMCWSFEIPDCVLWSLQFCFNLCTKKGAGSLQACEYNTLPREEHSKSTRLIERQAVNAVDQL